MIDKLGRRTSQRMIGEMCAQLAAQEAEINELRKQNAQYIKLASVLAQKVVAT
jgi:hypothetical protein